MLEGEDGRDSNGSSVGDPSPSVQSSDQPAREILHVGVGYYDGDDGGGDGSTILTAC